MNKHLRNLLKAGFVWLFMIMSILSVYAQERQVSGVVKDSETGETLIGVNVTASTNKSIGTVTDLDGRYSLSLPDTVKALTFSFVGYTSQTIEITSGLIDIKLAPGKQLSEVVVVGYGTQKVKEVTGAVTSVKEEDFNAGNVSNPIQLIQGKVAGLSIVKPGGDPNADFTIRLRGLSTFGSNTQPLFIVDGVQVSSLNSVDPKDVATYDVLKDASASAIYGTKAAQGVIIITTKKGDLTKGEKIGNVEFSTDFTMEKIARKIQVLSADEYLKFPKSTNLGKTVNQNGDTIQGTTDWVDAITQTAYTQAYNLAVNGGSEKSSYRVAFNYRQGSGVVLKTGYDQLNGRLNFQQKTLNDMLTLNLILSATLRNETYAQADALRYAARYNPTAPIKGDSTDAFSQEWGGYFQRGDFDFVNPVSVIEQNTLDGQKNEILGNLKADFEPIAGLIFSAAYSTDWRNELYGQYWSKNSYYTPYALASHLGYARKETDDHFHHLFEATGSYERNIDKFNFKILAGYSWQDNIDENFFAFGKGFLTDAFSYNNLGSASGETTNKEAIGSYKSGSTLIGYFGRLNGNWNDAVFATVNFRRDGSTMFGVNNKWGNFPGFSAGVDIRKFVEIPFVNRLKLRGSYGVTGNLPPYPYISQLLFNVTDANFFYNGKYIQAYAPIRNENPDLKWEVKKEWDAGIDFNMWSYRLSGSIDYYSALSTDLILNAPVPVPPYPSDRMWLNLGELRNSGVEIAVSLLAVQQTNFKWTTDVNFTKYFPTKLVKITNEISQAQNALEFGFLGAPYLTGYRTIIICQGDTLPGYYNVNTGQYYVEHPNYVGQIVAPIFVGVDSLGKIIVENVSGDHGSDSINYQKDVRVVGNGLPKFTIGWGNTFTYKGFYLNFFIRGAFGHSLVNVNNARYGVEGAVAIQNGMKQALDYMTASSPVYTNVHVEKADYVKLDNFSFGYNFTFKRSKYISALTLYLSGQNLFTITNYSGVDPEIRYGDSYDNNNPLAPGIDRENTYFRTRSLTIGVNLSL